MNEIFGQVTELFLTSSTERGPPSETCRMLRNIVIVLILAFLQTSCSDSSKELGSDYWLRIEGPGANEILSHSPNSNGIPPAILRYAYDRDFIIAEQKPTIVDDVMHNSEIKYQHGRQALYYWIIVKEQKEVIGPMTFDDFIAARHKYGLPKGLELEPVY